MLSMGDPAPFAERVRQGGARLIVQLRDLDEARQALDVGADVVVAQGSEAGVHGGPASDLAVRAGGGRPRFTHPGACRRRDRRWSRAGRRSRPWGRRSVDGDAVRGHARGAGGARGQRAIIEGSGEDTERSRVLDIARGVHWPHKYTGRTLRNSFLDQWLGREEELVQDDNAIHAYQAAAERGDIVSVWAGEAIDLITDLASAADLVAWIVRQAEEALGRAGKR
jgi:nitronate monooxygenase